MFYICSFDLGNEASGLCSINDVSSHSNCRYSAGSLLYFHHVLNNFLSDGTIPSIIYYTSSVT
jgi:hypothetical protein